LYAIRPCNAEDAPGVAEVARRTWHATYGSILPEQVRQRVLDQWYNVEKIAQRVTQGKVTFLVAEDEDGVIVGYAQAMHRRELGDAELFAIYVLPEHQGQRLGYGLLTETLRALQQRAPVKRLFIQVERENRIGRRFYDRVGFLPVREYEEDLFGFTSTMVEMSLDAASL